MAQNTGPEQVEDFHLRDVAGILRHILQLSAADGETGPIVYIPGGAIDFVVDADAVNSQNPPVGRIRLRWNGSYLEMVDSSGNILGTSTFPGLTDTPATYAGQAGRVPVVNVAEDGLEFAPIPGGGDSSSFLLGPPISYASEVQLAANVIQFQRVYLPAGRTMIEGQFDITALTGANASVRIGLYDQSDPHQADFKASGGEPNNRVAQSSLGNYGTTGTKTAAYTTPYLVPVSGYYWTAIVRNTGGGTKRFRSTGGINRDVTPLAIESTAAGALPASAGVTLASNGDSVIMVTTRD